MLNQFDIEDMQEFKKASDLEVGSHFKFLNAPRTIYQLVGKGPGNAIQYKHPIGIVYNGWAWEYVKEVSNEEAE